MCPLEVQNSPHCFCEYLGWPNILLALTSYLCWLFPSICSQQSSYLLWHRLRRGTKPVLFVFFWSNQRPLVKAELDRRLGMSKRDHNMQLHADNLNSSFCSPQPFHPSTTNNFFKDHFAHAAPVLPHLDLSLSALLHSSPSTSTSLWGIKGHSSISQAEQLDHHTRCVGVCWHLYLQHLTSTFNLFVFSYM